MDPIILSDNRLDDGTPTATTTDADPIYSVLNVKDKRAYTYWKALNTTVPCSIIINCGSAKAADAVGIMSHNLSTIGATVAVEYSTTGAWAGEEVSAVSVTPTTDKAILKTFTTQTKQYWRLKITGTLSAAPYIGVLVIGERLTFPFAPDPYNLYDESMEVESKRSKVGHLLGNTVSYYPVALQRTFTAPLRTFVTGTYKTFWDAYGSLLYPFFYADDLTTYPALVFWAAFKADAGFQMPISIGTYADSLTLDMEAIKEV